MREFGTLDKTFHDIVFYSEGSADWPHLGPVIESLVRDHDKKVTYLTSDPNDPGLRLHDQRFRSFQIGSGSVRTILFRGIECAHFVMTLPDLGTFHLKRSVNQVHYVYLFHSINSTHTIYRKGAFDAYDTLLCAGPHHVEEIRKAEALYGVKVKELVEHGSAKLDTLLAQFSARSETPRIDTTREVLIAPSWGECSLIEQPVGDELIKILIRGGCRTVLRLHPMTVRRFPKLVPELKQKYRDEPLFVIEEDMNATQSWVRSDVMVGDWSGAAIEYTFSLLKPVIFINTAQKINNPEWKKIGAHAFEDMIRFEIGHVVEPSAIATVPNLIDECCREPEAMRERILAARAKWVYNVGRSSQAAARYFVSLGRKT
jgi:YidC/Oxa1 family membrane protein insertase